MTETTKALRQWPLPVLCWSLAAVVGIGCSAAALAAAKPVNFVLQPGQKTDNLGDSAFTWPASNGVCLRMHWNQAQKTLDGTLDLSHWTHEITRAKQTKRKLAVDFFTGVSTPDYVKCERFTFTDSRKGKFTMPVPWDANYQAAVAAVVRRLALDLGKLGVELEYIHVSGPTRFSNEMHLPVELQKVPGYSLAKLKAAWVQDAKLFADCFPKASIAVNASVLFGNDQAAASQIVDACGAVLGKRMVVFHCALHGATSNANKTHAMVCSYSPQYRIGFEMIQPSTRSEFQGTFDQAVAIATKAGASYLQPYQGDIGKLK